MEKQIYALSDEGLSVRQIARDLGINRGRVHRVLMARRAVAAVAAAPVAGPLPLPLDDDGPVGGVRFAGVDPTDPRIEVFADERGRRFNLLDLYRHGRFDGGVLFADAVEHLKAARLCPPA